MFGLFINSLQAQQYTLNGNATKDNCNCYTLTREVTNQAGSVWNNIKINLNQSFDFTFTINLGCRDADGADGIVFVLQPISTSIGTTGGGMGFRNVSPSLGVTLDTWQNISSPEQDHDPVFDHIAIQANGNLDHNSAGNLAGPVEIIANTNNSEDCKTHLLKITWDAVQKKMVAMVDGVQRVSITQDIVNTIFKGDPMVFWGFTAGTGGSYNLQQFCTALEPAWSYNSGQTRCLNDKIQFINNTSSFAPIRKFYWNFGDGSPIDSVNNNPLHQYTKTGQFPVSLKVIGADGCEEITTTNLTISGYPVADFTVDAVCGDPVLKLSDRSTVSGSTISQWQWYNNGVPSMGSSVQLLNTNNTAATAGLIVKTPEGCSSQLITKNVEMLKKPVVDMAFTPGCMNEPVQFSATEKTGMPLRGWNWNYGDGNSSLLQNNSHIYRNNGNYTVTVTATASNGCISDAATQAVNIQGTNAYAGNDIVGATGQVVNLLATGGVDYEWMPASLFQEPYAQNPTLMLQDDTEIILKASINNACVSYDTLSIKVLDGPEIYVPTAFTPNGDGLNDNLRALPAGIISGFYFRVYNRFGQLMYETQDFNKGWNGRWKGMQSPAGTYVWVAGGEDFSGKKLTKKGTIILIR